MNTMLSGKIDRRFGIGIACLALLILALLLVNRCSSGATVKKPPLMLMSSIPLQWGEVGIGDIANGKAKPSPLFAHLSQTSTVAMIDDFQKLGKPGSTPLLLIQPRALAPRELVELDAWIRKGGTAIIFADPALDWPSELPLGDQRRPLFTSLLTPMFRHWGLELALPVSDEAEPDTVAVGDYSVSPKSAGIWIADKGKPSARCTISADELVALCQVGRGRALLAADADLLYPERWTGTMLASGTTTWLDAVVAASRRPGSFADSLWQVGVN